MNKANILKVAAAIEAAPAKRFDMSHIMVNTKTGWSCDREYAIAHPCKTAACVAGWAELISNKNAVEFLNTDILQTEALFMPQGWQQNRDEIGHFTSRRAVAVLRHLAETGEVAWEKFGPHGRRVR